jgi:hypothetical protein
MESEFLTLAEIANKLGITAMAAMSRMRREGRKPYKYIGSAGLYTNADLEAIRGHSQRGRPKAENKPKPEPKKPEKKP